MKKLLVVLLAIACVFTMFSCGGKEDESLTAFQSAADETKPATAKVNVVLETPLGELNAEYNIAYNTDGTATINYTFEKFNEITVGGEGEVKSTVTGTASVDANGNYTGDLSGSAAAISPSFNFDPEKMEYTISANENVLSANVKAENTADVLGVEYGSDVVLVMNKFDGKIVSFTLSYTTSQGEASVVVSYN